MSADRFFGLSLLYAVAAVFLSGLFTSVPCPQGTDCKAAAVAEFYTHLRWSLLIYLAGVSALVLVKIVRWRSNKGNPWS